MKVLFNKTVSNWTLVPNVTEECDQIVGYYGVKKRCSSGMTAVVWAAKNCNNTVVFGLEQDPCYPYRYEDDFTNGTTLNCTPILHYIPSRHDMIREHEVTEAMHRNGTVSINRYSEFGPREDLHIM